MLRNKLLAALLALLISSPLHAAISLPWTSSLAGDSEWDTSMGAPTGYAGIDYVANYPTSGGYRTQITSDANYSSGAGGRGIRNWTRASQTSFGVGVTFSSPQTELWIRFYIRFQSGMSFNAANKLLYLKNSSDGSNSTCFGLGAYGMNGSPIVATPVGAGSYTTWSDGAYTFSESFCNGSATCDGTWHCVEFHVKSETQDETPDGVCEIWIDGVRILNVTNANHGIISQDRAWGGFHLNTNTANTAIATDYWFDVDDLAINNTGYIGPLSGGSSSSAWTGVGLQGAGWQ